MTHRSYAMRTWLTWAGLWERMVAGAAMCPDGKVRRLTRIGEPDTWFSRPASVRVGGTTVSGYIVVESRDGYDTPTDDDPAVVKFRPYLYRRNWRMVMTPHQVNELSDFDPRGTRHDPAQYDPDFIEFIEFDMPADKGVVA